MGRFIDEHGLVQFKAGQRFSLDGATCEIDGCAGLRARFGDALETQALRLRDAGRPPNTGHEISTRTDSPLYIDHCHDHGWVRGRICAGCNSVMRFVDRKRCLARYMPALREEFRRHYNQCPDCELLTCLPTTDEIWICRNLVWICAGQKRFGASWPAMELQLRSHPFSGNVAGWLRQQAIACGLGVDDLVVRIAQMPYGTSETGQLDAAIARIREQLGDLQQTWAGSYAISLEPTKKGSWQARPSEDRRRILSAASAAALHDLLGSRSSAAAQGCGPHRASADRPAVKPAARQSRRS